MVWFREAQRTQTLWLFSRLRIILQACNVSEFKLSLNTFFPPISCNVIRLKRPKANIKEQYLPDRSVLSSQEDKCIVRLWDDKEILHSYRSDGSFLHSSQLCRLATHNKKHNEKVKKQIQKKKHKTGLHNIAHMGYGRKLQQRNFRNNHFLFIIQSLPIASAVVTEVNRPCHDLARNLS